MPFYRTSVQHSYVERDTGLYSNSVCPRDLFATAKFLVVYSVSQCR